MKNKGWIRDTYTVKNIMNIRDNKEVKNKIWVRDIN